MYSFIIQLPANFKASTTEAVNGFYGDMEPLFLLIFSAIALGALIAIFIAQFHKH